MKAFFVFLFIAVSGLVQAQEGENFSPDTSRVYHSIEAALQNPDHVYKLNLSRKKLRAVPPEIVQFRNLKELNLSKNKIRELPPQIVELQNLERLNLSSNKLKALPEDIGKLQSLIYLGLNRNLIESLPQSIGSLPYLEILELWDNELDSIPKEISRLTKLRVLELRGILFNDEEQTRVKSLLPNTKIYFSPGCNCK